MHFCFWTNAEHAKSFRVLEHKRSAKMAAQRTIACVNQAPKQHLKCFAWIAQTLIFSGALGLRLAGVTSTVATLDLLPSHFLLTVESSAKAANAHRNFPEDRFIEASSTL
jgi:hypothetical protein